KFLVVQNMDLRKKLKPVVWGAQGTLPTASHFVVILARKQPTMQFDSKYITHMMRDIHHLDDDIIQKRRDMYQTFLENDFSLLKDERATFDWTTKQIYIALGNMMTSAAMIGIDSCPIEGFKANELSQIMSDDFDINTTEFGVACMVSFGYRINQQKTKTRQTIEAISHWYR
ncbi:MAG: NAD(P)H-dependent oxidoreductase, partial [Methylococcales bacterium]|nr:NAD(P)H-dependent oxidoreductase [Methylococcales bacterium]